MSIAIPAEKPPLNIDMPARQGDYLE